MLLALYRIGATIVLVAPQAATGDNLQHRDSGWRGRGFISVGIRSPPTSARSAELRPHPSCFRHRLPHRASFGHTARSAYSVFEGASGDRATYAPRRVLR